MIRKSTTTTGANAGTAASLPFASLPVAGATLPPSKSSRILVRVVLILVLLLVAVLWISRFLPSPTTPNTSTTSTTTTSLRSLPVPKTTNYENCRLIQDLLQGNIASTKDGLPSAGKPNEFGLVFWLKTPVLRADVDNQPVVLLKYNKYLPKQHDLKFTNTENILQQFGSDPSQVFPKLTATCEDPGDGFHYILVEWVDLHPSELPKPTKFMDCFTRVDRCFSCWSSWMKPCI
jgi:hypothetical protein